MPSLKYFETELAVANVHRYFKTETHFSSSWLGPHGNSPVIVVEVFHEMTIHIIQRAPMNAVCSIMNAGYGFS